MLVEGRDDQAGQLDHRGQVQRCRLMKKRFVMRDSVAQLVERCDWSVDIGAPVGSWQERTVQVRHPE